MSKALATVRVFGETKVLTRFIKLMSPIPQLKSTSTIFSEFTQNVILRHSDQFTDSITEDNGSMIISSYMSIPNIDIVVFRDGPDFSQSAEKYGDGNYVFLEGFPFITEFLVRSLEKYIPEICMNDPFAEISVVLFDDDTMHFGATDLDNRDSAIKKALGEIRNAVGADLSERISNISVCKDSIDMFRTIRPVSAFDMLVQRKGRDVCCSWVRNVLECTDAMVSILGIGEISRIKEEYVGNIYLLNEVCDFRRLEKSCNDLLKHYSDQFYEKYYAETENILCDFYSSNVEEVCFWNLDKDIQSLRKSLRQNYSEVMYPKNLKKVGFFYDNNLTQNQNNVNYTNLVAESKVKTHFFDCLDRYYGNDSGNGTVVSVLMKHICKKAESIRKALERSYE